MEALLDHLGYLQNAFINLVRKIAKNGC